MAKKKSYDVNDETEEVVIEQPEPEVPPASEMSVIDQKIETILKSRMPEAQKKEYIDRLRPVEKQKVNRVSFQVYAKIRKIHKKLFGGMLAYPKAVGVKLASLQEWDEIFKDF